MPSVYDIKPAFQRLLRPLCAGLHQAGVTPNQLTAAALVLSFGMGGWLFLARDHTLPLLVFPLFCLVRMAANALDGMIAKSFHLTTPAGALMNEIADVLADAALYLPFAVLPGIRPVLSVAIVILAATSEVAGLAAIAIGGRRRHDGPMGKSDRALTFSLCALAWAAGLHQPVFWDICLGAILLMLVATIINRCRHAIREASV